MNKETKVCQNCRQNFTIEPEDFDFYKKIDVPPPTWCPQCRMIRKTMWAFGATQLYPRVCQAPGHSERIVSVYPETAVMPVYDYAFWNSDAWDPMSYGRDYDFSHSFFEQFKELLDVVPVRSAGIVNSTNCDYCIAVSDSKNCYLCSGTFGSENCLYSHTAVFSKECVDLYLGLYDEQVYHSFFCDKSFQATDAIQSIELVNCDFMYDCRACTDCLGCVGLRSKKYCIFNKQYSKEEYKKERAKYDLGSYAVRQDVKRRHDEMIRVYPRKYAVLTNAANCRGDNLINAKNCKFVFEGIDDIEDCAYSMVVGKGAKDSYDIAGAGLKSSMLYETMSSIGVQRVFFSYRVYHSHDVYYSRECRDSAFLFGCIGLTSKKYCIFNKQYSKDEYNELVPRIIQHMKSAAWTSPRGQEYRYGEFFPLEHAPFSYNGSWAGEYFPMTKKSVNEAGYVWRDVADRQAAVTMAAGLLPDHIRDVSAAITNEVIGCDHGGSCDHSCVGAFKITPAELRFYQTCNIALPRLCPACRFREVVFEHRTPYALWRRTCECVGVRQRTGYENTRVHAHVDKPCANEFETAYAPGRLELLYCESCYNAEIL